MSIWTVTCIELYVFRFFFISLSGSFSTFPSGTLLYPHIVVLSLGLCQNIAYLCNINTVLIPSLKRDIFFLSDIYFNVYKQNVYLGTDYINPLFYLIGRLISLLPYFELRLSLLIRINMRPII